MEKFNQIQTITNAWCKTTSKERIICFGISAAVFVSMNCMSMKHGYQVKWGPIVFNPPAERNNQLKAA